MIDLKEKCNAVLNQYTTLFVEQNCVAIDSEQFRQMQGVLRHPIDIEYRTKNSIIFLDGTVSILYHHVYVSMCFADNMVGIYFADSVYLYCMKTPNKKLIEKIAANHPYLEKREDLLFSIIIFNVEDFPERTYIPFKEILRSSNLKNLLNSL